MIYCEGRVWAVLSAVYCLVGSSLTMMTGILSLVSMTAGVSQLLNYQRKPSCYSLVKIFTVFLHVCM